MKRNRKVKRQNNFTLLEVLISFVIVLLCFFPLIYPHTAILSSQRTFIDRVELDHAVSLFYGEILEQLYMNTIPIGAIKDKTMFDIDQSFLDKIKYSKPFPYKGTYQFEIEKTKPKIKPEGKEEEQPKFLVHSVKLKFNFKYKYDKSKNNKGINYEYTITLIQDLEHGKGLSELG